jgi:tRNA-splicing ligase RtcB (3'-phosphate/5'-hydroxy nucleic acid ligase)
VKAKEILQTGIPPGRPLRLAIQHLGRASKAGMKSNHVKQLLGDLAADPERFRDHPIFGEVAVAILEDADVPVFRERDRPAPFRQWGEDLGVDSLRQMTEACRLPVAVAGALMPDAHVGYGLPIGGVLATENAVIPYAVGVDIACRMKLTVTDIPVEDLVRDKQRLTQVLERETRFGVGGTFRKPHDHEVMDLDWSVTGLTKHLKDKARTQLGTSGSGNHFVEYGIFTLDQPEVGLQPGQYVAILSHSGSRGSGAEIASHYSRLAKELHPELPPELRNLAWLDMEHESGQEYWAAMNLMGEYAAANHAVIHREMVKALKTKVLFQIENHHNFAWKERHLGKELIVHRKGATPAGKGVLGIIPGSMASPAFLVRGKGEPESLESASHGAGRAMSRTAATQKFRWKDVKHLLDEAGVTLLSAGIDENPLVYKDIRQVMEAQQDLVEVVARFDPKIVKMAPQGERPED